MKVIILAGGFGTRLSEETDTRPKPMVEIGGMPILWHIMKIYSHFGYNEFVICLGYKGYKIKEFFANYFLHMADVTFHLDRNEMEVHQKKADPWTVTLVDTGHSTMTGGRLKRVKDYIENETFLMTYGDGVGDVNIQSLVQFHRRNRNKATLTAVQPSGKFGALGIDDGDRIRTFSEKPKGDGSWINAGFFVLEPEVFDLIGGDSVAWESTPLETLATEGSLSAYKHTGFWRPMDTLRDKNVLNEFWSKGSAPWKVWSD